MKMIWRKTLILSIIYKLAVLHIKSTWFSTNFAFFAMDLKGEGGLYCGFVGGRKT